MIKFYRILCLVAIFFFNTDSGFRFVFGGDISGVLALECHLSCLCTLLVIL